jgi:hypothetical protein
MLLVLGEKLSLGTDCVDVKPVGYNLKDWHRRHVCNFFYVDSIYGVFDKIVSSSDYVALNDGTIKWIEKGVEGCGRCLIEGEFRHSPGETEENHWKPD